jgi:malonate transporter and related proteins
LNAATLLIPEASLIIIGLLLKRFAGWPDGFWISAEKLVYYVMFPALLFNSIVKTPLSLQASGAALGVAVAALCFGIALAHTSKWLLNPDPRRFASGVQCAFRFNSYVALAMAERVGGQPGLALCALVVGVTVPICNFAAVYPLARHSGANFFAELLKNPLILATSTGLLANLAGLHLPDPVSLTLSKLGAAALALGLICVGAGLRFGEQVQARSEIRLTIWVQMVKSIALPAFAWWASRWIGLGTMEKSIVTLYSAMPTASAAYILANRMGGDGPYVAHLISISLVLSMFALPFWLSMM